MLNTLMLNHASEIYFDNQFFFLKKELNKLMCVLTAILIIKSLREIVNSRSER